MTNITPNKLQMSNISEHPAVQAWIQLSPKSAIPESIEIVRERKSSKASIFRLYGVGIRGSPVIAKRCTFDLAKQDRIFYENILPNISIPSSHYYGSLDQDEWTSWLFLEDAGDVRYSPLIEEHRNLATNWMKVFHTSTERVPPEIVLPERGFSYYFDHLQQGRKTIQRNLSNPVLDTNNLILLRNIISLCDHVESKWDELVSICYGTPRTLTHGDFKKKNIYLRSSNRGTELIVLDWETAGIGIPTVDVAEAKVDVYTYWTNVRDFWPKINFRTFQEFTEVGKVLRYLASINWEAQTLAFRWINKSMVNMNVYNTRISAALQALKLIN